MLARNTETFQAKCLVVFLHSSFGLSTLISYAKQSCIAYILPNKWNEYEGLKQHKGIFDVSRIPRILNPMRSTIELRNVSTQRQLDSLPLFKIRQNLERLEVSVPGD